LNTANPTSARRLIIFTRYPEPGKTKTRLIPLLGATGAAELQRRMTEHLAAGLEALAGAAGLTLEIRFEGGTKARMLRWLGPQFGFRPQGEGDIGQRMTRAFADGFSEGAASIVLIGSDIPGITPNIINKAFSELEKKPLVLGPAADGGYYLIGMDHEAFRHAHPWLFTGIAWGTGQVLGQTLAAAEKGNLSCSLLPTLQDVDHPEDLGVWQQASQACRPAHRQVPISIIVPALNEAQNIPATLAGLQNCGEVEIIVVDGGSHDRTAAIAASLGARVITTAPCRSLQMNAGAAAARGEVLLFLHADTRLPKDFIPSVMTAVSRKGFCAGAFALRIDSPLRALRFIEHMANLRARCLQLPYGDQALFMRRETFNAVGGFPQLPIMEDFELLRRLKRRGKIVLLPQAVLTSPRRWLKIGILKTWLINQTIVLAYCLGVAPQRLERWYSRKKGIPTG